jgi:hypothetical protein
MKNIKTFSVLGSEGYFYEGEFSGTICFVPVSAIQAGRLNEALYVAQGWASLNIKAQKPRGGVGSHLFPDLDKPCTDTARCEHIKSRIEQLRPQPISA